MDLAHPWRPLLADGTAAVLSALSYTQTSLTGRTVSAVTGLSQNGARKSLIQLVDQGVVTTERAGSAVLYRLNRSHVLTDHLLAIVNAGAEVQNRLREAIEAWPLAPLHVGLFGSVARADTRAESDIDLLVVRPPDLVYDSPAWRRQLNDLATDVHDWTGQFVSWLEFSHDELIVAATDAEPIVGKWQRDAVWIAGATLAATLQPHIGLVP